jgi:branched-chain amino acid aminotransferase
MEHASLDGRIMDVAEATIPATDDGLIRGDGVFEVIRLYAGHPFALEEHLARLVNSGQNLRLPVDVDAVREDITRLLGAAPDHDGQLRIILTRGGRRLLMTEPLAEQAERVRLGAVTYAPPRILDGVKSLSYAGNMLATRLAKERGFDEALLVTPHGRVLEAPTASIFWVAGGRVLTPPMDEHILASITRAKLIELIDAEERACTLEDLLAADEAFLASTTREVMPVAAVEDRQFDGVGPVTQDARRRLRERIVSELAAART